MSDQDLETTFERVPKSKHHFLRGVVVAAAFAVPVVATSACHLPPGCVPGVPCQSPP
jgi:hypothetical protein